MLARLREGRLASRLLFCVLACLPLLPSGCGGPEPPVVVVYTSQDEVFAEPTSGEFQSRTGIRVRPVYDSESVKTVGLVNRLLANAPTRAAISSGTTRSSAPASWPRMTSSAQPTAGAAGLPLPPHRLQHQFGPPPARPAPSVRPPTQSGKAKWPWLIPCSAPPPPISWPCANSGATRAGKSGAALWPPTIPCWWTAIRSSSIWFPR